MRVAIIGGIGSGKSAVLQIAKDLGLHTLSADEINSQLLDTPEYIALIAKEFPVKVADGRIDKKALADTVFSDATALSRLNAIAHPQILKRIQAEKVSPLIVEMPLLVEIGAEKLFDEIVLVHTPLIKRLRRLKSRGVKVPDALRRMNAQANENSLKKVATKIIDNSGSIDKLRQNAHAVLADVLAQNGF